MTTLLVWLFVIAVVIIVIMFVATLVFFLAAIFYGMLKGMRDLKNGR